ncbi:MAG: Alanine-tRNA ligase [Candidatus Wolfebacteria bacterium GW2011_GWE2_44_13]|uniref:alanine--tRNA ligase n=1 Tax=Candidatus Wolfebacteria bacterium GW2011_GWE2_44_13 TaxID=1619017 RepID=A0A0G1HAZ0_9BACT|nr:MAG: Alanine-tRNA ligase [Candidatus Wolfebacteria bacterium GW2011_GWE2_44_13]
MQSKDLRKHFFNFFHSKGHARVASSSLMPDDPSVLLTTAGMQQFKKYYTGELDALEDFGSQRTVSIQKCFRTSDIEEVGDKTHLTMFEMMGNFSFGPVGSDEPEDDGKEGYFKRAAIHAGYQFMTEILGINPDRMYVTVFGGDAETPFDEEAYAIWRDEIKMPEDKIRKGPREDNFWGPTGEEGPCGPCTEIYVDDVEVWNIVFNEFFKDKSGMYHKAERPGIDTGMGFERLSVMLEGVDNVFESEIFHPIMVKINEIAPTVDDTVKRVFADHLRASTFLIADGIVPANKEAGYVLRRLLRRVMAYQIKYDVHADLFAEMVPVVKEIFGEIYPEINDTKRILDVFEGERVKFHEAVARGMKEIEKFETISGKDAFYLYESFGLPFELILELAPQSATENLKKEEFDEYFEKHQEVSRAGAGSKFGGHGLILDTGELKAGNEEEMKKVIGFHTATHLLNWALRHEFGDEVHQMGSDINPERLRFDFSFPRKMTPEEIQKVENLVNDKIDANLPVYFEEMPKEDAEKLGAVAFFKHKYPSMVKVYSIGSEASGGVVSREFCGGPHVEYTGQIGSFKITKEEAVSAGVRRIRATIG